jgi:hypothetical protein
MTVSKATVTRLFIGSLIAAGAGLVFTIGAVWLAIANNVFVMSGEELVGIQGGGIAWTLLGFAILGVIAIVGGVITGLISWIGALLNTWQVESKAWFIALLLLGIFNFGFFAMVAYVIAGPDGKRARPPVASAAPAAA